MAARRAKKDADTSGKTAGAVATLLAAEPLVKLAGAVSPEHTVAAAGLWGSSVAAVVGAIRKHANRPVLLVTGHVDECDDLADDVTLFAGGPRPEVMPMLPGGGGSDAGSEEDVADRMRLLFKLHADAIRCRNERSCCSASTVVGTSTATCFPAAAALKAARIASSVLP